MYRYETHCHTAPVSHCASASAEDTVRFYKRLGYDGIFLTNHFFDGNINPLARKLPFQEMIDFYFRDYEDATMIGARVGLKVFPGVELSYQGTDFLIYGLDKDWYKTHAGILKMKKTEELPLLMEAGALVIQAHPYREADYIDHIRLYPRCVHGVEVFNSGQPEEANALADGYAEHYGLLKTWGSDNHWGSNAFERLREKGYRPELAGVETERPIDSVGDFIDMVKSGRLRPFYLREDGCVRTEYPLERSGIALHLDCVRAEGSRAVRNILLVHGVTYSSREFDIDCEDYSLVRRLARAGWAVWRLDIAGFGRSGEVPDGFLPDSDYAAEDIRAAVERIVRETGQDAIDLLGWSWGTVTVSRFAAAHPEHVRRLVLYAPILSGLGEQAVNEPFHQNSREHAAEDFQRGADGGFDPAITDPALVERWCASCMAYDGAHSPNGGRRDLCVSRSVSLIDPARLSVPTLVICGDRDPYLDRARLCSVLDLLPPGSALEIIAGGGHAVFVEKPFHRDFQERLLRFLSA